MALKVDYREVMGRIKNDVNYVADEAYNKGYNVGKKCSVGESVKNVEYQRGLSEGNDIGYKDGVKDGRNEVWEAAKKVVLNPDEGGLDVQELGEVFSCATIQQVFRKYTVFEAIEKLKAYEEKQKADDKIKIGDEVVWTLGANIAIVVTSVYTVDDVEWCDGVCKGGHVYSILTKNARKTGRRFNIEVLEEMRNE